MRAWAKISYEMRDDTNRMMLSACEGVEAIISHIGFEDWAASIAEKLDVPLMLSYTWPVQTTSEFPSPLVTTSELPFRPLRKWSYSLYDLVAWHTKKKLINHLRASLRLSPATRSIFSRARALKIPNLNLWSPAVVKKPNDWTPDEIVAGFCRLQPAVRHRLGEASTPAGLTEWLERGPRPFFIGFGSMPVSDPEAMVKMAVDAGKTLGVRAVIGAGRNDLSAFRIGLPDSCFVVNAVDHTWLFPRCAGIVHHGGAGTTGTSLESGVPTMICSMIADQPFWGTRVVKLGVGTHVPFKSLDEGTLIQGMRELMRNDIRNRAAALGKALRAEDGVATAADTVEAWLAGVCVPAPANSATATPLRVARGDGISQGALSRRDSWNGPNAS